MHLHYPKDKTSIKADILYIVNSEMNTSVYNLRLTLSFIVCHVLQYTISKKIWVIYWLYFSHACVLKHKFKDCKTETMYPGLEQNKCSSNMYIFSI